LGPEQTPLVFTSSLASTVIPNNDLDSRNDEIFRVQPDFENAQISTITIREDKRQNSDRNIALQKISFFTE
jgi:hypothetical protein